MKKGSYWFSFLSEKEQKEFRENVKNEDDDFHELMDDEFRSFEFFLKASFLFINSKEGYEYWNLICKREVE
jgi:hypothetical protein